MVYYLFILPLVVNPALVDQESCGKLILIQNVFLVGKNIILANLVSVHDDC